MTADRYSRDDDAYLAATDVSPVTVERHAQAIARGERTLARAREMLGLPPLTQVVWRMHPLWRDDGGVALRTALTNPTPWPRPEVHVVTCERCGWIGLQSAAHEHTRTTTHLALRVCSPALGAAYGCDACGSRGWASRTHPGWGDHPHDRDGCTGDARLLDRRDRRGTVPYDIPNHPMSSTDQVDALAYSLAAFTRNGVAGLTDADIEVLGPLAGDLGVPAPAVVPPDAPPPYRD